MADEIRKATVGSVQIEALQANIKALMSPPTNPSVGKGIKKYISPWESEISNGLVLKVTKLGQFSMNEPGDSSCCVVNLSQPEIDSLIEYLQTIRGT